MNINSSLFQERIKEIETIKNATKNGSNSVNLVPKFFKISFDKIQKNLWNFFSLFTIIFISRRFLKNLKNLSFFRTSSQLNKTQVDLIGDICSQNEKEVRDCLDWFDKMGMNYFVLDPSKKFSIVYDFVVLIALSYFFFMIPLEIAYSLISSDQHIKDVAFFLLLADIFRNFNTAFYSKGKFVYSHSSIAHHYIKRGFYFDLLTLMPILFHRFTSSDKTIYNHLLFLVYLKMGQFRKIFKRLEGLLLTNRTFHHIFSLFKLIIWIIFISHVFACIWNYIGLLGIKYLEKSWLIEKNIFDASRQTQYLFSYYFVCVTMNTVGFGDIIPSNSLEIGFCIIFIFIACGMFAYNINSVGIILSDISKQGDEFNKDLNTINDFMRTKNVSFDLRMRIRKYLEHIGQEAKFKENEAIKQTINKLSDTLKEELLLEANGAILKEAKLFSYNFSEETLRKTVMILKEKRYTPGDIIFEKGDLQDNTIYIIKNGEVEILFGNSNHLKTVRICKKGDTFGEYAFFTGKEQNFSVRSSDFTNTFALNKDDFLSIISKNSKDFERFNEIKEKLTFYQDPLPLHIKCYACRSIKHVVEECPYIHYCPKKQIIIDKYLFNYFQERSNDFQRPYKIKERCMFSLNNNSIYDRRNIMEFQKSQYSLTDENDEDEKEKAEKTESLFAEKRFERKSVIN